ncbi:pyridoxal phosphate-dependent aminotransferase [uncultured Enterococcus sp.]|uniref:pyridoxal phosphate-dependent aminotransferase n=1 Tax=uncultured Enterococcus sp. TaxID=167972 RepID=UPI00259212FA|nr:pyridoxal phosphate-dependent aminotransferase [uncultured Enterococcus sp.]
MSQLTNRFNPQLSKIAVSLIRQFDEQVSSIPDMLKLTLGEPDFDTPEHVKQAGIRAIEENYTHYSGMAGLADVREAAAAFFKQKYGVSYNWQSEIMVTVGATEAISATLLSILSPGDEVILPAPIYPGYEPIITLAGATPVYIDTKETGFVLDPAALDKELQVRGKKVKAVVLNFPSNPTGVTYDEKELAAIAQVLKKYDVFVISDEIYSELSYDAPHETLVRHLREQTIVINGLSKSHAMTGWRIGFIFAPEELAKEIIKTHQYLVTAATTVSQKAALQALVQGINDADVMKEEYLARRNFVYDKMTSFGFEVAKPSGAFYIFAKIPAGYQQNSMAFCVDLAQKSKLAIIPGVAFGPEGEGYVRISYAASLEQLKEAMNRLESYMKE